MSKRPLGIGMLSGGLDSALATRILQEAGADIRCIHFFTGFCLTGHHSRVGKTDKPVANDALQVAAELEVPIELYDISEEYLDLVLHPRYGYGANMNPCIDCRIFMLRKARVYMEDHQADFVFTGEVIGQRPKSQMRRTLDLIEKNARLEGRLLRPLSARLLPPTIPELEGRIDREKLLGLAGRSRKTQLELARHYKITSFAQPAGGCCFLTDEAYSRKFMDILKEKGEEALSLDDVFILGVGRHFRLAAGLKVVIGRDEAENNFLSRYTTDKWSAVAKDYPGPLAVIFGEVEQEFWREIASMVARYSDGKHEEKIRVEFLRGKRSKELVVSPASDEFLDAHRI